MKILITGGAGFIGSHLAEALLSRGARVWVIDDLSTGSLNNIAHIRDHKNFRLVIDSIFNRETLERLIKKSDVIFHLAAAVGVKTIMENPIKSLRTNVLGAFTVLELARRIKTITGSSSPIVYIPYRKVYQQGFVDIRGRAPSLSKIKRLVGFEPTIGLTEALKLIVEAQKEQKI